MEQSQQPPVHSDQHRSNFNLTLIFALAVAGLGLFSGPQIMLVVVGLAMAVYSWVTTPRQYLIYRNALVIVYGKPRVKAIPFAEISHLETLALPMGERLRIRLVTGKREMLAAKDPDTFRHRLDDALDQFNGEQRGTDYVEGSIGAAQDPPDYASFYAPLDEAPPATAENLTIQDPATQDPPTHATSSPDTVSIEDLSSAPPPFDSESGLSQGDDPRTPKSPY